MMNVTTKYTLHVLHDLAGAAWFGGNLFGVVALNAGVAAAEDARERGAVLNRTWEHFAPYSVASVATLAGTWAISRAADPRLRTPHLAPAVYLHDLLVAGAVVSTVASGVLNRIIARDERVPVATGTTPTEETPQDVARAQVAMKVAAASNLILGAGIIMSGAVLEQHLIETAPARSWRDRLPLDGKALAAAELVRRAGRLLNESIDALRPHEPSTAEQIKHGAYDLFTRASELIGSKLPDQPETLSRVAAGIAGAVESAGDLLGPKQMRKLIKRGRKQARATSKKISKGVEQFRAQGQERWEQVAEKF